MARRNLHPLLAVLVGLSAAVSLRADDFYCAPNGVDAPERDGRAEPAAWRSLAYACDRVAEGGHTIHVLPGTYIAVRTAYPKNGVAVVGRRADGPDVSRIIASTDWPLKPLVDPEGHEGMEEYLIAASGKRPDGSWKVVTDLTVSNLELCSDPKHRITGAFYCRDGTRVKLQHLRVHDFRWNGLRVEFSKQVEIENCHLEDASTEVLPWREGGLIRTRWLEDSRVHHNRIIARKTYGYGYKGGGHRKFRFDHNFVDTTYFAYESPFEDEFEVDLDHNHLTRCISIPRDNGIDPKTKGYEYGYRIHHNYLTDSYTVEGPRGYLEFDHNWVRVEKLGGRIYSHHGAHSSGPIWIHHNVIENVSLNLIWMNEGRVDELNVVNNTIFCADDAAGSGAVLDSWSEERLNKWRLLNNILVCAWSRPRPLHSTERGVPKKIEAIRNLLVNVENPPPGNFVDLPDGLTRTGAKPFPFYRPRDDAKAIVDQGVDVGLPFLGKAPDLGALEVGEEPWKLDEIPQP
ncbi:MAG: hypothetical protein ACRC1K_05455 [Planctomycetia bacterium]